MTAWLLSHWPWSRLHDKVAEMRVFLEFNKSLSYITVLDIWRTGDFEFQTVNRKTFACDNWNWKWLVKLACFVNWNLNWNWKYDLRTEQKLEWNVFAQVRYRHNMSNYGRRAFCFAGPCVWNSLPEHQLQATSIAVFKRSLILQQISRLAH